ncbi:unnamed protein product [Acanthoscelides obtectus]|uniref:Fas apoptotic inhibitory molecule 1 n=1 Tax=Acanthoscelides obtectus TaxID=200917 RepID=A0A9P0KM68_ACAOB|nr:unnamed protein product [Acanthoscelides obtectus]CAK1641878.1 Fas apoptotic inhibitory molecule 1 [Acanthoscelides obtectus]
MTETLKKTGSQDRTDLVAYWSIPLLDGVHTVEFEHGHTTGKRVIRVDGKEIVRKEWVFKLVGDETFEIGNQKTKCVLRVDPLPHFAFRYSLYVDGKPLEQFTEKQSQNIRSWTTVIGSQRYRIVLEKQALNVYVNGQICEAEHSFVKDGSEITFPLEETYATIKATSADENQGVIHQLYLDGKLVEEDIF